ncbi:MFS transporter [Paenibacillus sp. MWE-103]|uniref:MFS transporter n=1 Tax=Paenibacillus artemisiicola TaxID=1172618 RepID=A0ABS3W4T2_9BACL|nr:MFS transporter [Paenibacillus artemisiicola]MBO7743308.1 MFS transporter [Paenibacillus artemisiicola]
MESQPRADKLIRLLCFILLFSVMNVTMFNIALPDISRAFGLLPSEAGWVITGYSIIYAVGSLTYGKLADRYPLRRLLTIGLLLFAAGSLLGFLSPNYATVLAARFVQSAGASSIPALVMIVPVRMYAPEGRGRVLGILASAIAFASGVGPIVGGFVSGWLDWRYLFLISIGTLAALPFLRKWLPDEEPRSGKFDLLGALLLGGSVTLFMLGITQWSGWLALTGALLLALFVLRIVRTADPFVQPAVFRSGGFRSGLFSSFLVYAVSFTVTFVTPMLLNAANGLGTSAIGLLMFPAAMSAAVFGRYGGKLADRRGSLFIIVAALILLAAGQLALSLFSGGAAGYVAACLVFGNVGAAFYQAGMTKLVASTLPAGQTGVGMGILTLGNFLSCAIAGAVVSKLVDGAASGSASPAFGVFGHAGAAAVFGNVYFALAALCLLNLAFVWAAFGRRRKAARRAASPGAETQRA